MSDRDETFSVVLRSEAKTSGNNNNYLVTVPWSTILPTKYNFFKLRSACYVRTGAYMDFTSNIQTAPLFPKSFAEVRVNLPYASRHFDTLRSNASANATVGALLTLGVLDRNVAVGNARNTVNFHLSDLAYTFGDSPELTISRPSNTSVQVQFLNLTPQSNGRLLTQSGTTMNADGTLNQTTGNSNFSNLETTDMTDNVIYLELTGLTKLN
jgi:hypothetical protein